MDRRVACLPGLTRRRTADLHPCEAKTDAREPFVIADAARSTPHTLRSVELDEETVAELEMIVGSDDDLAGEATHISNRLRGLLTQIQPHSNAPWTRASSTRAPTAGPVRLADPDRHDRAYPTDQPDTPESSEDGRATGRGHPHGDP